MKIRPSIFSFLAVFVALLLFPDALLAQVSPSRPSTEKPVRKPELIERGEVLIRDKVEDLHGEVKSAGIDLRKLHAEARSFRRPAEEIVNEKHPIDAESLPPSVLQKLETEYFDFEPKAFFAGDDGNEIFFIVDMDHDHERLEVTFNETGNVVSSHTLRDGSTYSPPQPIIDHFFANRGTEDVVWKHFKDQQGWEGDSDGLDAFYSEDGTFNHSKREISIQDLPTAVHQAVNRQYTDHEIDDVSILKAAGKPTVYEVHVEHDHRKAKVFLNSAGGVVGDRHLRGKELTENSRDEVEAFGIDLRKLDAEARMVRRSAEEIVNDKHPINAEDLPVPVLQRLEDEYSDFEPVAFFTGEGGNEVFFIVDMDHDHERLEVTFNEIGTIVGSHTLRDGSTYSPPRAIIDHYFENGGTEDVVWKHFKDQQGWEGDSDGLDAFYSEDGAFDHSKREIDVEDLPATVHQAVNRKYTDHEIDDVAILKAAGKPTVYEVHVEHDHSKITVFLNEDGDIVGDRHLRGGQEEEEEGNDIDLPEEVKNSHLAFQVDGDVRWRHVEQTDVYVAESEEYTGYYSPDGYLRLARRRVTEEGFLFQLKDAFEREQPGFQLQKVDVYMIDVYADSLEDAFFHVEALDESSGESTDFFVHAADMLEADKNEVFDLLNALEGR